MPDASGMMFAQVRRPSVIIAGGLFCPVTVPWSVTTAVVQ
jgi:hypothetical protein